MKKTISIVIPVYNEKENIPLIYGALQEACALIPQYDYEYIFVNDGGNDGSDKAVASVMFSDKKVKYIEFSRNFGKEMATTAGLEAASGDAAILIDADLQHPPVLIPEFIRLWEGGYEIVIGVRTSNKGEGAIKRVGSKLFYRIMGLLSETSMRPGETDFRLIDRAVINAFLSFKEHQRMTRSLLNWLGFKKEFVSFDSPARKHGSARYSIGKLFHLAIYSFVNNSLTPLRFAGYLGFGITVFSGLLGFIVLMNEYVFGDPFGWKISGSAQLAILNVFLIGIVLMALGIISLYIGNINSEAVGRPLYVVRRRENF